LPPRSDSIPTGTRLGALGAIVANITVTVIERLVIPWYSALRAPT
jgi:hypothetical protein